MLRLLFFHFLLNLVSGQQVWGQSAGDLDLTFNGTGIYTSDSGIIATAILPQPDGKVVLVGYNASPSAVILVRLNTDGTPDATFGTSGIVQTDLGGSGRAYAAALQPDGKIVVVGHAPAIAPNYKVVRYQSNGSLDPSFGTNGIVTSAFPFYGFARSVDIQADGRIVVAGLHSDFTTFVEMSAGQYLPDGTPDSAFGTNGLWTGHLGSAYLHCYTVAVQPDGKYVLGGSHQSATHYQFALARIHPDGTVDSSFGTHGLQIVPIGQHYYPIGIQDGIHPPGIADISPQPDGKIVAAGYAYQDSARVAVLLRFNVDGSLDNGFSSNAAVIADLTAGDDEFTQVMLLSDSKILASGKGFNGTDADFLLVRYHSDGSPDASFGNNGIVLSDMGGEEVANAMAPATGNRLYLAGQSDNGAIESMAVARYYYPLTTGTRVPPIQEPHIRIYPNPVAGELHVYGANGEVEVVVCDIRGRVVLHTSQLESTIDVSHLNRGLYLVQIVTDGEATTHCVLLE